MAQHFFLVWGNFWLCINSAEVHKLVGEKHPLDRNYFLGAGPLPVLPGLFPERRTGTFDTGILVRAGGGALVFGGRVSGSKTEERADWLAEWGGEACLLLTGILESRGRLELPFIDWKEEEDEEGGGVWEVGLDGD